MRRALSQATQNDRPGTKPGTVAGMRHYLDSFDCPGFPRWPLFEAKPAYCHPGAIRGVAPAQSAK